ncbi:hypothetical protein [Salegentibacter maritimus]|uniref:Uncharacterized protein n=1 Tax=Salegentibacter maritimus TaxID=2794347 RepID=A0ABS0TEH0_9FLAO|nr:hypothetical protein [Salegentibacter maritimus]MBI6116585.1 hypothetical protein [Salegentibacter maritimus]MBI6118413.1 hypothetical protein [Salegentibacter maritimus]
MRNNSYLVNEPAPNSYSFKDLNSVLENKKEEELKKPHENNNSKKSNLFSVLISFWNRLVATPKNFPQAAHTEISSILKTEKNIVADKKIKLVLSKILDLPVDSENLLKAVANSKKIFHEDYPFDFILEYQNKRLGMMLLDVCYNEKNQEEIDYNFNPELKSFKGLF